MDIEEVSIQFSFAIKSIWFCSQAFQSGKIGGIQLLFLNEYLCGMWDPIVRVSVAIQQ